MEAKMKMMEKMLLQTIVSPERDAKDRDTFSFGFEFQLTSGKEYCVSFQLRNRKKNRFDIKNWRFEEASVWVDPGNFERNKLIEEKGGDPAKQGELEHDLQDEGLTIADLATYYLQMAGQSGYRARDSRSDWPR